MVLILREVNLILFAFSCFLCQVGLIISSNICKHQEDTSTPLKNLHLQTAPSTHTKMLPTAQTIIYYIGATEMGTKAMLEVGITTYSLNLP
mgnify:CR=1 FL=1